MVWALLPLKDLVKAKTRLSGVLAPHERRALAQAMVEDVISVLVTLEELEGILLVSDDPAAELLSHKYVLDLEGQYMSTMPKQHQYTPFGAVLAVFLAHV